MESTVRLQNSILMTTEHFGLQDIPAFLHGIDSAAERLYDVMYEKLSKTDWFKRTGSYLEDVRRIGEMQRLIDEEIRNELIYSL